MNEDEEFPVTLSLRAWRIVASLVEAGAYRDVQPILAVIYAEANARITAANERAIQQAIEEVHAGTVVTTPVVVPEAFAGESNAQEKEILH